MFIDRMQHATQDFSPTMKIKNRKRIRGAALILFDTIKRGQDNGKVIARSLFFTGALSESVLDAESRTGALTAQMPKATPNNNPFHEIDSGVELVKPKSEAIKEIGLTQKQVEHQGAAPQQHIFFYRHHKNLFRTTPLQPQGIPGHASPNQPCSDTG